MSVAKYEGICGTPVAVGVTAGKAGTLGGSAGDPGATGVIAGEPALTANV